MKFILYIVGAIAIGCFVMYLMSMPFTSKNEREDFKKSTISYATKTNVKINTINFNLSLEQSIQQIIKGIEIYENRSKEFNDYKETDEGHFNYVRVRESISFVLNSVFDDFIPTHSREYYKNEGGVFSVEQSVSLDAATGGLKLSFVGDVNRTFRGVKINHIYYDKMTSFIIENFSKDAWHHELLIHNQKDNN